MKRTSCAVILSAAVMAACVNMRGQSNVYSVAIYASGTTYWDYGSFAFPFPPYRFKLSGRGWYEDGRGLTIINAGHEKELGGIHHRVLEVECGADSFTIHLEPGRPNLHGVAPPLDHSVLAVVMESSYPEAPTTLTAVLDGSAGFYSTNGGRMVREGQNRQLNLAVGKLVAKAGEFRSACTIATEFPSPQKAHTRFYIITPYEVLTAEAEGHTLGTGVHRMSPIFQAAQDLIAQIRRTQWNEKAEPVAAPNAAPPHR